MTDTHDLVSREEALAALDSEQQLRQSNYDEAFARSDESDVATCRAEAQRIAEIKVLWNILAALPAIPPPALTESFLNELIDADETRQQGDIHEVELVFDALIRFRDAILNSGALPVLETKKEES